LWYSSRTANAVYKSTLARAAPLPDTHRNTHRKRTAHGVCVKRAWELCGERREGGGVITDERHLGRKLPVSYLSWRSRNFLSNVKLLITTCLASM